MINMTTFNSWINNQDYNFDVAVVRVDRPVGALSGWLGFSWNTTSSFYTSNTFHNPGYPGSPAYNGETMRYWFGFYDSVIGETPRHNNQGYGGQSGSNSWVNQNNSPTVYALLSHGTAPPEPVWTGHVRIDQNKFNTILNYINNHTPSQPDLIPLLAEASPTTVQAGSALSSFSFIIHNYSSIAFSGAIQFKVYLSTNNIISASDTEIWSGSVSNASISAKGSNTVNISTNLPVIPSGTSAGNYYLGVLITSSDANNNNNATAGWDTKPITVSGGGSPNATCSAAATITCGQTVTGTTSGAAQNVSNCGGFDLNTAPGLWYRYTATQTGQVTATTCNSGTTFDTKIGVFSGSCSNLVCVGGNDDDTACSSNLRSTVQFSASSGQTYYIYVTGFQTNSGTFQLSLTCTAAPTLTVSPATISQTAAAGSANISVTSTCSSWTVSGAPAWATVSPTSGSNNGTITVSFQANTSTQSRSATLTISGCSITRTVTITQTGTATSLEVSPATISQTAAAGSANISVTSNCSSWTVSGAPAWATVSPTSGSNNGTITVSFQANTSAQSRSATLTISGCSITRTVTITQEAVASTIPWVRSITGSNHIIIVQSSLTATLDGTPLEPGDAIGFFFEHNGALHCSSYLVLSGQNQSVAVYGNDPTAPGKNGFESGEIFRVKVYKAATQQVHDAQVNFAPAGTVIPPLTITHTNTFAANGISLLTNLNASTNSSFRIVLNTGWNMISSHTLPADANMPVVFSDLTSVVEVVKDVNGDAYFPVLNINGLGNWDMTKGYQVRSAADTVLTITGSRVDPAATPIPINSGWQIISYLRTQAAPISEQLASITGIVELVKDNLGVNTYIPGLMINSIGDMRPGQGYQLKASAPGTLTYPANQLWSDPSVVLQSASPVLERAVPAHFEYDRILKSCHNSTLIIRSEVASAMMEPGDEIGVFSTDGILCGAAVFEDRHFAVTIWGDDPTTLGIPEGLLPGEVYQLRIWKSAQNSETNITPVFTSGDEVYHNDDIEIAAHFSTATAVKEPSVEVQPLTVFPNPTGGRFYVMLPAGIEMLELRDAKGALLQRVSQPAGGLLPMETAGYPKGLLLLSAWDAMGRRWYAKVVVQ